METHSRSQNATMSMAKKLGIVSLCLVCNWRHLIRGRSRRFSSRLYTLMKRELRDVPKDWLQLGGLCSISGFSRNSTQRYSFQAV